MTIPRRTRAIRLAVVALLLGGVTASAAPGVAAEVGPYPGSLPDTASAVTVQGRGPEFSDLSIHVNQTSDLTTQAVSVTWSWPGRQTLSGQFLGGDQAYDANVLRIMQCWGDPVTSPGTDDPVAAANYVEADPGPAREHCVYGGSLKNTTNATSGNQQNRSATQYVTGKPTAYGQETAYKPTPATSTSPSYPADIPFIGANGTVVPHQIAPTDPKNPNSTRVYHNEFYDSFSTNELPANYTFGPDGRGGVQFQVQNSNDSRGTGCGALAEGSTTEYNKCWLVVVPQGTLDYNGKPLLVNPRGGYYSNSAYSSPLASTNWSNRIVVPLNFLPSISACAAQGSTYETLGSPLVNNAMLSWQSKLCSTDKTVYNYAIGTDARSRDALASGTTTMQFTSQPVPPGTGSTPVTYAPVTLSGLGIAFVWDRSLNNTSSFVKTPGLPLPTIKLNQRLVAKLLTYSYQAAGQSRILTNSADNKPAVTAYQWLTKNPTWLGADPEFLALNPDLQDLGTNQELFQATPTIATLQGPLNSSDAIARLWKWVMSDQSARDFMAGKPAPGNMTVDPYYNTDASQNPTGVGFSTDISGLPYADPWTGKPGNAEPLCKEQTSLAMTDIWPAARDFPTVAKDILTVNPLEKYSGGFQCTVGATTDNPPGWKTSRTGVVVPGTRQLAGLTDTASGAQYGVTYASIPNAHGDYVEPTTDAISAAANHLTDTGVPGVQQPDLATDDPAAYPLSLVAYAGVTTNGTSKDTCAAYAQLLDYAGTDGQTSGTSIGDLPPGYVPLSATLRAQTLAAAKTVAACAQAPAPPADQTTTETGTNTDTGATGDNGGTVGGDDGSTVTTTDPPGVTTPNPTTTPLSLSPTSRTKPDPSAFAYVVPIALGIGVLALLAAPVPGLRRRRPGGPA